MNTVGVSVFLLARSSPVLAYSHFDHVIYMDAGAADHAVATPGTALLASAAADSASADDTAARRERTVRARLTALGVVVD